MEDGVTSTEDNGVGTDHGKSTEDYSVITELKDSSARTEEDNVDTAEQEWSEESIPEQSTTLDQSKQLGMAWHIDLTIRCILHLNQHRWSILSTSNSPLQMSLEHLLQLVHVYTILAYYTNLSIIFPDLTLICINIIYIIS